MYIETLSKSLVYAELCFFQDSLQTGLTVQMYIVVVDDVFREKSTFMVDNGVCLIFTDKKWGEHLVT